MWETMLKQGSFIIDGANYPEGFYIVLVLEPQDACGIRANETEDSAPASSTNQKLKITIKENSPEINYWLGTGIVGFGYLLVLILSSCIIAYVNRKNQDTSKATIKDKCNIRRRMTNKTVHDLYKLTSSEYSKNNKAWYETNPLFWVILVQTGMFYSLPTIQMVLDSSRIFTITGNQDYCYYNSLCQRPLGDLRDFNHIFSNLGYVVLGCMFHYIVHKKEENEKLLDSSLGIPRQYSLYYAMGHSLIGIGVMSSCYHVCPTTITFQFDTTYMYLLAFFMIIKIYQSRHPDLVCSAFRGFLFLGVCLVFEVNIYT